MPERSPLTGVTVVMPVYNRATLVADAIESVLAQDWPRDRLELLVVDDGSTDETPVVLEAFRGRHPDVLRVVRQPNGGVSEARNTGVRGARFPYIAFLDSDDLWAPEKLTRQMELLTDEPDVEFVYTALADPTDGHTLSVVVDDWDSAPQRAFERLLIGDCIVPSSVLASRRILVDAGLFDPALPIGEDYDMWLKLAAAGHRMEYLREPLTIYVDHDGGLSRDTPQVNRALIAILERHLGSHRLRRRRRFLAQRHLNNAVASLEFGDHRSAAKELARAMRLHPRSIRPGWLRLLLRAVAAPARSRP